MRILFVKLSSIGDVIHTLPALEAVKRAFPKSSIEWVVEKKASAILQNNPLLSRLIEVDTHALRDLDGIGDSFRSAKLQFREIRESKFDFSIDFQGNFKSATIAKLANVGTRYGFEKSELREPASRLLQDRSISIQANVNVITKNILLAQGSLQDYLKSPDFRFQESPRFSIKTDKSDLEEAKTIANRVTSKFAILNPAGGWATKLWSPEKYGKLADRLWSELGIASIVTTAPNEIELAKRVASSSHSGKTVIDTSSLKVFYELCKLSEIYVGGDTAPTHIAIAAKTPVVGIFGPTEWWRNGSISEHDICVERTDIGCRENCHRRSCENWICMEISVETVFAAVVKRLETRNKMAVNV